MEQAPTHAIPLYDNAALRRVEAESTAASGDSFALMQRAGQAAWRLLLHRWPQAQRIVVACGTGNNGGDGYVLALHALQAGRAVEVVRTAAPGSELAMRACHEFEATSGRCTTVTDDFEHADVIVDALFGIGLSRPLEGAAANLVSRINDAGKPVLALDVPTGVDAQTGNVAGEAVRATATLQLLASHCGLLTGAAIDYCGELATEAIGVNVDPRDACAFALRADALGDWLQPRARDSHKGTYGHVLCVGGDAGSGGAIALCAQAALRSGAGLVSVATRAQHVSAIIATRPEIMAAEVEDAAALTALLERASVIAIGPGLGQQAWGAALLDAAMKSDRPLVLDADALNLMSRTPRPLPSDAVITPHPGEAARLLGCDIAMVQSDRFSAAKSLTDRFGCVVVLKGAGTIVAARNREPCVIAAGNPGMAVGGMGDLLTGVIAALRAQGLPAFDAAACGALLHAVAGDDAAADGGERGLLPSDLLVHLRRRSNQGAAA
jgi:ADP-dependent NAD(P)H-hydrate dehydratase / NAD(P)H-hydrate epimerase